MSAAGRPAAVLWDMDGTLIDTEPYWMECEYELVAEFGGRWTDADAHAIVGADLHESGRYIRDVGGVDLPIDEIVNRMIDGVIARVRRTMPWRPGARDLLAKLRASKVPCALVTMSWRRLADAIVGQLPPGSFAATIVGDEVSRGKPHPEPYLAAARALNVSPRDCVVLEDSPRGVRSAKSAGCHVIAIPHIVHVKPRRGVRMADSLTDLDVASLLPERRSRRRPVVLATAGVLLAGAGVGAVLVRKHDPAPPPPIDIPVDAWAPYWTLPDAQSTLATDGRMLREVSPFWYSTHDASTITPDGNLAPETTAAFVAAIRAAGAKVVPSISDAMDAGQMAALLADPATRATHVAAIADLAATNGFDGIDIDYEKFAFSDPRSTWATTRPVWIEFISQLGARLHADGRTLTVTVPYIVDSGRTDLSGYWVYDYGGMEPHVDRIRVMAYDYSTDKPGPIAPLSFIEQVIKATGAAVKDDSKLVLGVALYGYNWPIATVGTCPPNAEGRTSVTQRTIDELLAKRGATAIHDPTTGESSFTYQLDVSDGTTTCTQTREVHYVDAQGAQQRIDLARRERLGGVSLWALGFDSPATWQSIASLVRVPGATTTTSTVTP
jgi:beta-phosphoglucomutase-like phosphatase (HAD superfamily)/spore germination protein YaaH